MNRRSIENETKLPQWAQRRLQVLRADLESANRKLTKGPENSTVFVDPYADHPRPLGTDPTIEFRNPAKPTDHLGYIQVCRVDDGSDGLRILGSDVLVVVPHASNVVTIYPRRIR